MKHALVLWTLPPLLAACASPNPYTAQSAPLPPAPASAAPASGPYPAAPADYSRYRNWAWQAAPAGGAGIGAEQFAEALSEGLDQRGLRPLRQGTPDLTVGAELRVERRLRQVYDDYGGYYGYGPGYPYRGWGPGYGAAYSAPVVRTYAEDVLVVRIDLFDAASRQLVWSGSAEAGAGGDQAGRAASLREAIRTALQHYPPA